MTVAGIVMVLGVDRIVMRVGDLRVFRLGTVLAAAGLGFGLLVGTFPAAVAGFVVLGVGMGCAGPPICSFAGSQTDVSVGEAVSVLELGDSVGALIAPTLIGAIAATVGLRFGLGAVAVAAMAMALLAGRAADPNAL